MSIVDKVVAAVTPEPSEKDLAEARAAAGAGDGWLAMALDHHLQIESAFAAVKNAADPQTQRKEQKRLALLLSGHSPAEETVLYPAMALIDRRCTPPQPTPGRARRRRTWPHSTRWSACRRSTWTSWNTCARRCRTTSMKKRANGSPNCWPTLTARTCT